MANKVIRLLSIRKKRLGRGYGSGKGGHTSGRGQKGQKSRGSVGILFEGFKVRKSFVKRLPLRRGKGKFKAGVKPLVISLGKLNVMPEGSKVNVETLAKYKLIESSSALIHGAKILSGGKLTKKITIEIPISASAAKEVEKAGGKVI